MWFRPKLLTITEAIICLTLLQAARSDTHPRVQDPHNESTLKQVDIPLTKRKKTLWFQSKLFIIDEAMSGLTPLQAARSETLSSMGDHHNSL
jgi:hypothetical protein